MCSFSISFSLSLFFSFSVHCLSVSFFLFSFLLSFTFIVSLRLFHFSSPAMEMLRNDSVIPLIVVKYNAENDSVRDKMVNRMNERKKKRWERREFEFYSNRDTYYNFNMLYFFFFLFFLVSSLIRVLFGIHYGDLHSFSNIFFLLPNKKSSNSGGKILT